MGDLIIKPASSGNLKIQSDSATNVLTVGTDDSVTLGTEFKVTSTSQTFTVKGIDAAITDSQTGTTPDVADSDSGQLAIYNSSTKLWGISEHGYVVNPKVPCFTAIANAGSGNYAADPMIFNVVLLNNESMYNASTGRATAPIPGIYYFCFVGIKGTSTNSVGRLQFKVNGSDNNGVGSGVYYPQARGEAGLQYTQMVSMFYVNLAAGDYVTCDGNDDAGMWANSDGQNAPYFCGCLIG